MESFMNDLIFSKRIFDSQKIQTDLSAFKPKIPIGFFVEDFWKKRRFRDSQDLSFSDISGDSKFELNIDSPESGSPRKHKSNIFGDGNRNNTQQKEKSMKSGQDLEKELDRVNNMYMYKEPGVYRSVTHEKIQASGYSKRNQNQKNGNYQGGPNPDPRKNDQRKRLQESNDDSKWHKSDTEEFEREFQKGYGQLGSQRSQQNRQKAPNPQNRGFSELEKPFLPEHLETEIAKKVKRSWFQLAKWYRKLLSLSGRGRPDLIRRLRDFQEKTSFYKALEKEAENALKQRQNQHRPFQNRRSENIVNSDEEETFQEQTEAAPWHFLDQLEKFTIQQILANLKINSLQIQFFVNRQFLPIFVTEMKKVDVMVSKDRIWQFLIGAQKFLVQKVRKGGMKESGRGSGMKKSIFTPTRGKPSTSQIKSFISMRGGQSRNARSPQQPTPATRSQAPKSPFNPQKSQPEIDFLFDSTPHPQTPSKSPLTSSRKKSSNLARSRIFDGEEKVGWGKKAMRSVADRQSSQRKQGQIASFQELNTPSKSRSDFESQNMEMAGYGSGQKSGSRGQIIGALHMHGVNEPCPDDLSDYDDPKSPQNRQSQLKKSQIQPKLRSQDKTLIFEIQNGAKIEAFIKPAPNVFGQSFNLRVDLGELVGNVDYRGIQLWESLKEFYGQILESRMADTTLLDKLLDSAISYLVRVRREAQFHKKEKEARQHRGEQGRQGRLGVVNRKSPTKTHQPPTQHPIPHPNTNSLNPSHQKRHLKYSKHQIAQWQNQAQKILKSASPNASSPSEYDIFSQNPSKHGIARLFSSKQAIRNTIDLIEHLELLFQVRYQGVKLSLRESEFSEELLSLGVPQGSITAQLSDSNSKHDFFEILGLRMQINHKVHLIYNFFKKLRLLIEPILSFASGPVQ